MPHVPPKRLLAINESVVVRKPATEEVLIEFFVSPRSVVAVVVAVKITAKYS